MKNIFTMREINKHGQNRSSKKVGFYNSSGASHFFGTFKPLTMPDYDHIREKSWEFKNKK